MHIQQVKDMLTRAVHNNDASMLNAMSQRYLDTAKAHEILRHKGYGGDGVSLLDTVKLVQVNMFSAVS